MLISHFILVIIWFYLVGNRLAMLIFLFKQQKLLCSFSHYLRLLLRTWVKGS